MKARGKGPRKKVWGLRTFSIAGALFDNVDLEAGLGALPKTSIVHVTPFLCLFMPIEASLQSHYPAW